MKNIMILCSAFFLFLQVSFCNQNNYVLVTGGAGYIGSHACKALKEAGFCPVAYDSLLLGDANLVKWGPLIVGDLMDVEKLDLVFSTYKPVAVMHFAGLRDVGESVKDPALYYTTNVMGTINLLNVMKKRDVKRFIFSSSCTVYGSQNVPVTELDSKSPTNPYASSKLMVEKILEDFSHAYDFKYIILRYFNVAGIDLEAGLKRSVHSQNFLIPRTISSALHQNSFLTVFGSDYPTEDGTAVRDYIHVKDLVRAHILALEYLQQESKNQIINLGSGIGYSVLQIIQMVEEVTGKSVPYELASRKEGDVAFAVANPQKSMEIFNFAPKDSDLRSIIKSEVDSLRELDISLIENNEDDFFQGVIRK